VDAQWFFCPAFFCKPSQQKNAGRKNGARQPGWKISEVFPWFAYRREAFAPLTERRRAMFKFRFAISAATVFVLCSIAAAAALAQPPQKFVSARNGNDSGSCTANLPCRTFAAALAQVPPRGIIIALDAGDYGPVTINKSVTIAGPVGGNAEIRVGTGPAVIIEAGASDIVTLRGLTINGSGLRGPVPIPEAPGILFRTGEALHIENCVVNGFFGGGIHFGGAGQLFVKDTIVRNCTRAGIEIGPGTGRAMASIDHCRLEKNDRGLSAFGNVQLTVRDSVAAGNEDAGFSAGALAVVVLENCVATGNEIGISAIGGIVGSPTVYVSNSTIAHNNVGLRAIQSSLLSRLNNTVEANRENGSFTGAFQAK
jgi:hypothetical protein